MPSCARVWEGVAGVMLGESAVVMVTLQGVSEGQGLCVSHSSTGAHHTAPSPTYLPVWPWASYLPLCTGDSSSVKPGWYWSCGKDLRKQ